MMLPKPRTVLAIQLLDLHMKKTFTHTQQMSLLTVQHGIIYYSLTGVGHHEGAHSRCFLLGRQMRRRRGMCPAVLGWLRQKKRRRWKGRQAHLV